MLINAYIYIYIYIYIERESVIAIENEQIFDPKIHFLLDVSTPNGVFIKSILLAYNFQQYFPTTMTT